VPSAPSIQSNTLGDKAPARTFQDLLGDEHDEALLAYHATTQLVLLQLDGSAPPQEIGPPAMLTWYRASPDAKHVIVEALSGEFSRAVLLSRFATDVLIYPLEGGGGGGAAAARAPYC